MKVFGLARIASGMCASALCAAFAVISGSSEAAEIKFRLLQDSYLCTQPLELLVNLVPTEKQRAQASLSAEAQMRLLRSFGRSVFVTVYNGKNEEICKLPFVPVGGFAVSDPTAFEVSALGLAFFGMRDEGVVRPECPTLEPGSYTIQVILGEELASQPTAIKIESLGDKDRRAAALFTSTLPAGALALVRPDPDGSVRQIFEELERDYPETIFGQYAAAAAAFAQFKDTFERHNNKGGQAAWGPTADRLERALDLFGREHPLSGRLSFELARARAFAGDAQGAKALASSIGGKREFGVWEEKSQALVIELADWAGEQDPPSPPK